MLDEYLGVKNKKAGFALAGGLYDWRRKPVWLKASMSGESWKGMGLISS
jgi:hypothetical protein